MLGLRDKIHYFGYELANYIIKVYTNVAYLSTCIYLFALENILIYDYSFADRVIRYRKTHTQPEHPDFFFVAWNSLKYGENSYCIAYLNKFYPTFNQSRVSKKYGEKSYCIAYFNEIYLTLSQNRVKSGPKFVL